MEHIPKIVIRPIDWQNHRYSTCGDWLYDAEDNVIEVRVSRMTDWRSELAVALHEVIESVCCLEKDISEAQVTAFDIQYEKEREEGKHSEFEESGDDKAAPYHDEHVAASFVEREVCSQLKLDWKKHEQIVNEDEQFL